MRGKKPKERKKLYFADRKRNTCGSNQGRFIWNGISPGEGKNTSRNRNRNTVFAVLMWCRKAVLQKTSISQEGQPEEMAVRSECLKKLKESLEQLPEQEAYLIYLLFF